MTLLIINADDYGLCNSVNRGIVDCLSEGVISDLSFMLTGADNREAIALLKSIGKTDIGCHLNVTAGKSMSPTRSALTDTSGNFFPLSRMALKLLKGEISFEVVYHELKHQIDFLRDRHFTITHLDSHRNIHLLPGIMLPLLKCCSDSGLTVPIRMPYENPTGIFRFRAVNIARITILNALTLYCRFRTRYRSFIRTIGGDFYNNDRRAAVYSGILEKLGNRRGLIYEMAVHPGYPSAEIMRYDTYNEQRSGELSTLMRQSRGNFFSKQTRLVSFSDVLSIRRNSESTFHANHN